MSNKKTYKKSIEKTSTRQMIITCGVLYIVTAVIHIVCAMLLEVPPGIDEYRTFLTGEFLSGKYDLSLLHMYEESNLYYGWGQVIFYIPFFYIFNTIGEVYRAALIFNSLVISWIPVLAYLIFEDYVEQCSCIMKAGFAFAVGMFSPLLYNSLTVMNETFLLFLPTLILYVICHLLKNERVGIKHILSGILGILSMYCFVMNARGIAITITTVIIVFITEIIQRRRKISLIPFLAGNVIIFLLDRVVKRYIINAFLHPFAGTTAINASNWNIMQRLADFKIESMFDAFSLWFNNWFYIIFASAGIVVVLFVALFMKKSKDDWIMLLYALGCVCATCGMLFFVNYKSYVVGKAKLIDQYIYGRYYDLLIPVILIVGFIFLLHKGYNTWKRWIGYGVMLLSLGFQNAFAVDALQNTGSAGYRSHALGVMTAYVQKSFAQTPLNIDFLILSIGLVVLFVLIEWMILKNKMPVSIALMLAFFIFPSYCTMKEQISLAKSQKEIINDFQSVFEPYMDIPEEYKTIYYLYEGGDYKGPLLQYAMYGWKVAQVDITSEYIDNIDMIEDNSFVLTKNEALLDMYDESFCFMTKKDGFSLYSFGEELASEIGIKSEKERKFATTKHFSSDDLINTKIILEPDDYMFGPAVQIDKGEYVIEVRGVNLAKCTWAVVTDNATTKLPSPATYHSDELLRLKIQLDEAAKDLGIRLFNQKDEIVVVNSFTIYDSEGNEYYSTTGESLFVSRKQEESGRYIEGEAGVNITLLLPGCYEMRLEGSELDEIAGLTCNKIAEEDITLISQSDDACVYRITIHEMITKLAFSIESKEGKIIRLDELMIEKVDD